MFRVLIELGSPLHSGAAAWALALRTASSESTASTVEMATRDLVMTLLLTE
jgi:hypothetical protein